MSSTAIGLLVALVLIGAVASYLDVVRRVLPNWLSALAFVVGLVGMAAGGGMDTAVSGLLHALIALVIGMGLFAVRVIGGGDAKYYAALAAWFGLGQSLFLFVSVALAGLLLIPVWLLVRRVRGHAGPAKDRNDAFSKLPYGVAISLGACAAFALLATSN